MSFKFNVLRIHGEKFKTLGHITAAVKHNFRMDVAQSAESRIDEDKSHLNQILYNPLNFDPALGAPDFQHKLMKHYEDLNIKIKKDNVLMLEWVISASPEFFEEATPEEIEAWKNDQVEFMKEEFGQNLKMAMCHLDETTVHIHFFSSTEIESVKKYKNQKGEFFKKTWSLNAERYNPEFLKSLHDRHAVKNKKYGLLRGIEGSTANNETIKDFNKRIKKVLNKDYSANINSNVDKALKKSSLGGIVTVAKARELLTPFLNNLILDLKAFRFWANEQKRKEAVIEKEAEKLKNKEAELNKIIEDMTNAFHKKNEEIIDLRGQVDQLVADVAVRDDGIRKMNKIRIDQGLKIVEQQNEIKRLKDKYEPQDN